MFDDPTAVEHRDVVDVAQRREPVGDHEGRATAHQRSDRRLEPGLRDRVDPGGRLVQHDHVGVPQPHSRHREELRLPRRQPRPAGPQHTFDPTVGERIEADRPQCGDHIALGRFRIE